MTILMDTRVSTLELCACTHARSAHVSNQGPCMACGPEREVWEINDYRSGERVISYVTQEPSMPLNADLFTWSAYSDWKGCDAFVKERPRRRTRWRGRVLCRGRQELTKMVNDTS